MKKIFILIILFFCIMTFGQKETKTKIIDFYPAFRYGFQLPIHTGDNYFAKDLSSGFGFHSTLSLVKIYNFRLSLGYEFQKLKVENPNIIGNFDFINSNTYQYILEYEIPINSKFELNPTISYGQCQFNYKENTGGSILAKQNLEEIRFGSYINYSLNKTFAGYAGFHFSYFYNSDLNAASENKDYFGKGNKFIISIGILIK
jgi:hypothetical protein